MALNKIERRKNQVIEGEPAPQNQDDAQNRGKDNEGDGRLGFALEQCDDHCHNGEQAKKADYGVTHGDSSFFRFLFFHLLPQMLRTNAMLGFEGREAAVDDKIEYLFYEFGRFPLSETGEKQIPVCSLSGRVGLDLANHVQNGAVSGFQHGHHLVLPFQVTTASTYSRSIMMRLMKSE